MPPATVLDGCGSIDRSIDRFIVVVELLYRIVVIDDDGRNYLSLINAVVVSSSLATRVNE